MFAKWTEVNGIKCQGKTEARVCQALIDLGFDVNRGKYVETPEGRYTPDFDIGPIFIEVKGINSWYQACGLVPMMENARDPKLAKISDKSLKKMLYVNNIKPVYVIVDLTSSKKSLLLMDKPNTDLNVFYGYPNELKEFLYEFTPDITRDSTFISESRS